MTKQFIIIEDQSFPIDTTSEEAIARDALRDAGLSDAPIWHGEPDDSSAYQDSVQKLFASKP